MSVETVEKKAGAGGKKLRGDASKVVVKGAGLKRAMTNRVQNLTVDVKEAGKDDGSGCLVALDYYFDNYM